MSYESDIFDAIRLDFPLSSLIGDRLFWDVADGSVETPYLVAQTISAVGHTTHDGKRSLEFPLVQFVAWGKTKAQAKAVANQFANSIEGRNLPGSSNSSLGYSGSHSSYDEQTKLFGEILEYRVSATRN